MGLVLVMLDWVEIDSQMRELIRGNRLKEAEALLLKSYEELKKAMRQEDLDQVIGSLAQFYSMPEAEDRGKAERFFLEREQLTSKLYPKLQTATFYFYVLRDFPKTIAKVHEIGTRVGTTASPSYYSALALKGLALLELNEVAEAASVLDEMELMTKRADACLPYGDEISFLERAMSEPTLIPSSRSLLVRIVPRIRSQEYVERGRRLLS
jgi:hypothetical protein